MFDLHVYWCPKEYSLKMHYNIESEWIILEVMCNLQHPHIPTPTLPLITIIRILIVYMHMYTHYQTLFNSKFTEAIIQILSSSRNMTFVNFNSTYEVAVGIFIFVQCIIILSWSVNKNANKKQHIGTPALWQTNKWLRIPVMIFRHQYFTSGGGKFSHAICQICGCSCRINL